MSIESVPLIASFNKWVEELPSEHRSKAYGFAESFLSVGAMHGAFVGDHGALASVSGAIPGSREEDSSLKSSGDKQDEYLAYLRKKAQESGV